MKPTEMLTALLNLSSDEYHMANKDIEFIDALDKWIRSGNIISDIQEKRLKRVYGKAFPDTPDERKEFYHG